MQKIGVVGAGAMGHGIAQVAATAGCSVMVVDTSTEACEQAETSLSMVMTRLVEKEKVSKDEAAAIQGRIQYSSDMNALAFSDLVIEAVVEDLHVKRVVFASLESIVSDDCILATNTSSLSITSIAASCREAARVVGIHFFNPAPLMPLVELVSAEQSDRDIISQCKNTITGWGKTVVQVRDTPGFIVNRVARPFYGEALRIYDERFHAIPDGTPGFLTIDWAMREIGGFRMGPFELMDLIGNDINYAVSCSIHESYFYDLRYRPSLTQKTMVDAGYLGRKSGRGYYDYSEDKPAHAPVVDEDLGRQVVDRIVIMLINEAAEALFWGVAGKEDIDMAMVKGANYPKGLLRWADEIGIEECVKRMDNIYDEYKEGRYRCSTMLRRMLKRKESFYG